jgi:hypothetical protein
MKKYSVYFNRSDRKFSDLLDQTTETKTIKLTYFADGFDYFAFPAINDPAQKSEAIRFYLLEDSFKRYIDSYIPTKFLLAVVDDFFGSFAVIAGLTQFDVSASTLICTSPASSRYFPDLGFNRGENHYGCYVEMLSSPMVPFRPAIYGDIDYFTTQNLDTGDFSFGNFFLPATERNYQWMFSTSPLLHLFGRPADVVYPFTCKITFFHSYMVP